MRNEMVGIQCQVVAEVKTVLLVSILGTGQFLLLDFICIPPVINELIRPFFHSI